jgi:hypothetical protein
MESTKAPYSKIDKNMVNLIWALNTFEGIRTIGSRGGHAYPQPYQRPERSWLVTLRVEHSERGWCALEFLTWYFNDNLARSGERVWLSPHSAPPYRNIPGKTLYFTLKGKWVSPEWLAKGLSAAKKKLYVCPAHIEYGVEIYDEEIPF